MTADEIQRVIIDKSPIAKVFEEYKEKTGGNTPVGRGIGYPDFQIDEKYGGEIGLYHECIKQGKTWEELLGYEDVPVSPDIDI